MSCKTRNPLRRGRAEWAPLIVAFVTVTAYVNSFSGSFLFDDFAHIHQQEQIHSLWLPWVAMSGTQRPVVALTLACNYAVGGLSPRGYHAFNLVVHLLAALALYGVIRRTLLLGSSECATHRSAAHLGFAVAAIWSVHPLLTQGVTYIIQRAECLMGLCYLFTIYCLIRSDRSRRPGRWHWVGVAVCALGMGTKAVMVSAPIMALLFDRIFLAGSLASALRRRWRFYLGLAATWSVLFAFGVMSSVFWTERGLDTSVGFAFEGISPVEHALTQPGVIVLIGMTIWGLVRAPWLGFVGAWFFVILAPTSSFVPVRDPMVEHRMYLSLISIVVIGVLGGFSLARRFGELNPRWLKHAKAAPVVAVALVVLLFTLMTIRRNNDYESNQTIWRDTKAKRPANARAHLNFGTVADDPSEAVAAFRQSLRLQAEYADALYGADTAEVDGRRSDRAIELYHSAIEAVPEAASAHYNLGNALGREGKPREAVRAYRAALTADPGHAGAHLHLGNAYARRGLTELAVEEFLAATAYAPDLAEPYINLGIAQTELGRFDDAMGSIRRATRLLNRRTSVRTVVELKYRMGVVSERLGQFEEATGYYEEALRMNPSDRSVRSALSTLRGIDGTGTAP